MNNLWVRVDNTDPAIRYTGPWGAVDGRQYDTFVANGKTFQATLCGLQSEGSLSFTFYGASGRLVGTNVPNPHVDRVVLPSWTCAMDGIPVLLPPTTSDPTNNWPLCEWSAMPGPHTLTLNVSVGDTDPATVQPFLVDYISYDSASTTYLFQKHVELPASEPLNFDSSWVPFPPHGMSSGSGGSSVTVNLYGTGFEVLGYIPSNQGRNWTATTGTFSLDDATPVPFNIPSSAERELNLYQYIKVQDLEQFSHKIAITYSGNSTTMPLILSTIITTSDDPRLPSFELPFPSGPVVGGTLGCAAALLGLGAVAAWLIRRRRARKCPRSRLPRQGGYTEFGFPANPVRGDISTHPTFPVAVTTERNDLVGMAAASFISEQPPSYTPT